MLLSFGNRRDKQIDLRAIDSEVIVSLRADRKASEFDKS